MFSPRTVHALGPRRVWAASCSLCPSAVLVVAGAGNQLQTCSPSGRWRMGPEKALCVLAPSPHPSPATEGPTSGPSQKLQKSDFWELPSRKGNSAGKPSSAPVRVSSGKQRFPVNALSLCSPMVRGVSGLQHAPCAPVVCWWWPELETHSKLALLGEMLDGA